MRSRHTHADLADTDGRLLLRQHTSRRQLYSARLTDSCRMLKARLHGSPRLINTVESMKLNSTVERYCLHGSTQVNEAVDFKMTANELVREGVVVICDYLIKECQHILEKRNKMKKRRWWVKPWIMRRNTLGAANTLLVEWANEDRDMYKNHLRMSREQFFELLSKVKPYIKKQDATGNLW